MTPDEWNQKCSRNRSAWLRHNAKHPWEPLRFYCGMYTPWRMPPRTQSWPTCPRCGEESCTNERLSWPTKTEEGVTQNLGGGPKVHYVLVTELDSGATELWVHNRPRP